MSDSVILLGSFLLFMLFFAGVGLASMRVKEDTTDDYLVAGRGMHPALAALSAVSTWNSGYMFIGFIGFVFIQGYSAIWIALVSTVGQVVAWIWLYKYIQKEGHERGIRSLSSLVSNTRGSPEAKLAAVLSVVFLSIYAAAQLTAGGVALNSMLGWSEIIGILIGFVLVVAYCYAGGIRASIWTDAAQSCVMIVGSTILCVVALQEAGGLSGLHSTLKGFNPGMVNIWPSSLKFGATLWLAAFFLGGLGIAGQPQVVSRVMTLKDDKARKDAAIWFFVWQTPFIILMFFIGLTCRAIFLDMDASDAETGLPVLAMEVLNPFLAGVILASIFAATMSTADSQVLACTAAITDDIRPQWSQDHSTTKKVTLGVAVFATVLSLVGQQFPGFGDSVFALVILAVYGLGAIFVPLLLVRMMGYEPDTTHTIAMMVAAMGGVIMWIIKGYPADIFPSVPGMGAAFITHFLLCNFREQSSSNPFGRYSIPARKTMTVAGVVVLFLTASVEASYYAFAPDESETTGGVGTYLIEGVLTSENIANGTEYVNNGETFSISFHTDQIEWEGEGRNVVAATLLLTYQEDESSNGIGCAAPGASNPDPDTITGLVNHDEFENTSSGQNQAQGETSHEMQIEWYNSSLISTTVSGMSEGQIIEQLDVNGAGMGDYSIDITVDSTAGGGLGCQHTDDGENVDYELVVWVLDYEIKAVTE
ncbi:MAG: sodium/proline symporter [Candidatus Poseidoniales archaeon]|nr:sodium/proline symporter [Candidatus Poseidoniales archaeon]